MVTNQLWLGWIKGNRCRCATPRSKCPTHSHHAAHADADKSGLTMTGEKQTLLLGDPKKIIFSCLWSLHKWLYSTLRGHYISIAHMLMVISLKIADEEQTVAWPKEVNVQLIVIILHSPMLASLVWRRCRKSNGGVTQRCRRCRGLSHPFSVSLAATSFPT